MRKPVHQRICSICFSVATVLCVINLSFAADRPPTWEEKYREEPYIILRSEQTVELRKDFTTLTKVRSVMKVQKDGAKNLGEISLNYDKSREEVKDIQAFTITPEGEKLKYKEIQDLNPRKEYAVYSDERTKMITMPHVVVGSIIDWQATVEATKPVIEKNFYDTVYLSSSVPVKLQKYTLIAPKGIDLHIKYVNTGKKPVITYSEDKVIYTWETAETDKIEHEDYMPPWEEVYETVAISTLDSWEEMSAWAWNLFKKNLQLSDSMKKKVEEITKGKQQLGDKVQAIIEYIQEDFRYVSISMDYHSYEPHPSDQVFSNKYGDCKDHTLLGMAMLSEIGVKAYPVLFPSNLTFNRERLLPMPTYFNHAILFFELEGKRYYSDLLRKGYYFYEVPSGMSQRKVYVVDEKGGFFGAIPRMDDEEAVSVTEERAVIQEDGNAIVEATVLFPRNASISIREEFKNMSADDRQKMFASLDSIISSGGKVLEKEWKNLETPHARIILRVKYENSHWVKRVGNMMMFGIPQQQRGTLFTTLKRRYPVVFLSDSKEEKRVFYTIPEGYEVLNLPKDVVLDYDFAGFERTYKADGNRITGKQVSLFKESRTPAEQYAKVQSFYDDITRLTNDLVLIKKKD